MIVHIAQQGECLSSLAARYGLAGWEQLHEHPANAELRSKRPNPNILAPGDEVVIPDRGATKSLSIETGRAHTFIVNRPKVKLRIAIADRSGKPYEGKRFVVNTSAGPIKGTTASGGLVQVEVPASESRARLRVWLDDDGEDAPPTIVRELAIGHMDPIDTISGVQGRLSNLGYRCPITNEIDSRLDGPLLSAALSFRARHGLPEIERPREGTESPENNEAIAAYAKRLLDDTFREKLVAVYEWRPA